MGWFSQIGNIFSGKEFVLAQFPVGKDFQVKGFPGGKDFLIVGYPAVKDFLMVALLTALGRIS